MKVIKTRNISRTQAEKEILGYLKKRRKAFTSQIADDLHLDVLLVNDVLKKLAERGAVK